MRKTRARDHVPADGSADANLPLLGLGCSACSEPVDMRPGFGGLGLRV
jgi:hypothetical protein